MATERKKVRKMRRRHMHTIIPVYLLFDPSITLPEAVVLAEIDALDGENGCYAMNKHFALILRVSEDRARKIISDLVKKGWLARQLVPSGKGAKRYLAVVWPDATHPVYLPGGDPVYPPGPPSGNTPTHPADIPGANIDENTGENTGERPPAPLSEKDEIKKLKNIAHNRELEPEEKSRFSYLNSKNDSPILSLDFFEFFEREVLGRFNKYTITPVILADWHRQLFEKFGADIAIAAVSDHAAIKKGWQPSFAAIVKIAKAIDVEQKNIAAGKIAAEKRAAARLQKQNEAENNIKRKKRPPVREMTAAELIEWRQTYVNLENNFMVIEIDKETAKRKHKRAVGE